MKGYVLNVSHMWTHAMKRSIGPGAKIPLDELYEQYGVKHSIEEGQDFIEWLRNIKLRDTKKWKIVLEEDTVESKESKTTPESTNRNIDLTTPMVKTGTTVADVVDLSVRKAREKLPKINDLKLLKYALQEANKLAGKDSLCKIIRKRIKELQIAR